MQIYPNFQRIDWDYTRLSARPQPLPLKRKTQLPIHLLKHHSEVWLEVGSGPGHFFCALAQNNPEVLFIPIERDRHRGRHLLHRSKKINLDNFFAIKGNAITAIMNELPNESIDRVYILYPCPYPKTSQRKNRWYLHPVMSHLARVLKISGLFIWASDQSFYLEEARYVCEKKFGMDILVHGKVSPHDYNHLLTFPMGRTKFERCFFKNKLQCFELIAQKVMLEPDSGWIPRSFFPYTELHSK